MSRNPDLPPAIVADRWEDLLADARATAAEYRESGWNALVVHTAEVEVATGGEFGLVAVAPDNEVAELRALAAEATFESTDVYCAESGGVRFLVVVNEAPASREVVLVPAYLPGEEARALEERAREAGRMTTHVRTLADEARVTFSHDDPAPFF